MSDMLTAKINVTKIDKNRLFSGKQGTYLDLVFIPTPDSEFGDYMIKQQCTKEEREAKVQMPILGNAKFLTRSPKGSPAKPIHKPPDAHTAESPQEPQEDDVPF